MITNDCRQILQYFLIYYLLHEINLSQDLDMPQIIFSSWFLINFSLIARNNTINVLTFFTAFWGISCPKCQICKKENINKLEKINLLYIQ